MTEPEKKEELRPCPFCSGHDIRLMPGECDCGHAQKPLYVRCFACGSNGPVIDDNPAEKWNSAYCWKEIDFLRQQLKDSSEREAELVMISDKFSESVLCGAPEKIIEEDIKVLREAIEKSRKAKQI